MTGNEPILPALKPYDWTGREFALCRPLLEASGLEAVPWVGYGYNHPNTFEFISRESFPTGSMDDNIRLIEQAALRNLRERPLEWKVETVRLGSFVMRWFQRMSILIGEGDFLAAEHLLDPLAMRQAAKQLKARQILAGTPSRGVLVATKANQSKRNRARFCAMVAAQYHQARVAPISPMVFIIEDGQIIGTLMSSDQARFAVSSPAASAASQPGEGVEVNGRVSGQTPPVEAQDRVFLQAIITADRVTGKETLHLLAGDADFDRLSQALLGAFAKSVGDMLSHPDFSGQVRIILVPELTPRTPGFEDRLARLQEHFNGVVDDLNRVEANGERAIDPPLDVRIVYGLDPEKLSSVLPPHKQEAQQDHENKPASQS